MADVERDENVLLANAGHGKNLTSDKLVLDLTGHFASQVFLDGDRRKRGVLHGPSPWGSSRDLANPRNGGKGRACGSDFSPTTG
jgi:hypothetical protein